MKEIVSTYALTAGEVSPSFYGRQDLSKYGVGDPPIDIGCRVPNERA